MSLSQSDNSDNNDFDADMMTKKVATTRPGVEKVEYQQVMVEGRVGVKGAEEQGGPWTSLGRV